MEYIGEHLLPGKIGHFFTMLSLVASLVATFSFFKASRQAELDKRGWLRIARTAFLLETVSVLVMFGVLYYIISNHLFEYKYAWQHSDRSLQIEYLLACFWEGQEGSFMLWSFWHCVLGWILIWRAKEWEAGTMAVVSFAQFCLATMLAGIYLWGETKLGSNPFVLLRNEMDAPIFSDPNYLQAIYAKDGQGLNALLQNYWMVIHPPVLFLGFASTLIPFAFAFAGLMNNNHDWIKRSLPWAAFSAGVLGLGIMMGAAWAYESLSFGGYWAWDPVENASLVPWLTLIAGLHTNLIFRHSGYSLKSTYFFYIISFILILYSTFLTRSGVLGDTSVHAFTDLGMNWQLLAFLLIFLIPALTLFFIRGKSMPSIKKEENTYSREFWMFIGSLVLFLSASVIIAKTSTPVFNKLFGTNIAPPEDPAFAHNQIQIFVAIILGLLTAVTQYFKYKDTPKEIFGKKILIPTIVSLVISLCISIFGEVDYREHGIGFLAAIHMAIFAAVYTIIANAAYIWIGLKGKMKNAGASIAHVGFGLTLLGILISSSKKTILSWNKTGVITFKKTEQEDPAENTTLFKGVATDMGKYMVTYIKDSLNPKDRKHYYELKFVPKSGAKPFTLYPDVIKNNKGEGFSANPDSKHYLHKDIFAYLTSFQGNEDKDTVTFKAREAKVGDTIMYSNGFMVVNNVLKDPTQSKHTIEKGEIALILDVSVTSIQKFDTAMYTLNPGLKVVGNEIIALPDSLPNEHLAVQVNRIADQQSGKLELGVKDTKPTVELVTLKVYEFPMINVLWLGIVVMTFGFLFSMYQRIRTLAAKR